MKQLHNSWRVLGYDLLGVGLCCASIFIALKFVTFFEHWVYFPLFPNICDSIVIICTIVYLVYRVVQKH